MAINISTVSDADMAGGFVLVPEGKYVVQAQAAEEKTSKAGNPMMYVEFRIIQDKDGSKDFEDIVVKHWFVFKENDKGKNWGLIQFAKFCNAAGIQSSDVSEDDIVASMPVEVDIEIEAGTPYIDSDGEEREGNDQNRINPFSFVSGV